MLTQEEYDPLDEFMAGVTTEVKIQPSKPTSKPAVEAANRGLDEEYDATDYLEVWWCLKCVFDGWNEVFAVYKGLLKMYVATDHLEVLVFKVCGCKECVINRK